MSYPSEITNSDIALLKIISKGNPSERLRALTWAEIKAKSDMWHNEFSDSIAHLVSNNLIKSTSQLPGFFAKLRGAAEIRYFWITDSGREFLELIPKIQLDANAEEDNEKKSISEVADVLKQLGYKLTKHGTGVALLELQSGYSVIDTASHIALTTMARDISEAGNNIEKLIKFVPHASAIIEILEEWKNQCLMSEMQFQNDGKAFLGIVLIDAQQENWINKVLADPIAGRERLANSRIK